MYPNYGEKTFRLALECSPFSLNFFFQMCLKSEYLSKYTYGSLNLKTPIMQQTTNYATSALVFNKNKVRYFMRIVCQQTILMKYHTLFVIYEKAVKFEIVICCKLYVGLYGVKLRICSYENLICIAVYVTGSN